MNFLNPVIRILAAGAIVFCLFCLAVLAYIHLGPFLHSQKQYSGDNLVGIVSGERFDGHFVLVEYRFNPIIEAREEVWVPAYGQEGIRFTTYSASDGTMQLFSMEKWHGNETTISMAAKGKALELDAAIREKAMQLLQLGRKRFIAAGGVLSAHITDR